MGWGKNQRAHGAGWRAVVGVGHIAHAQGSSRGDRRRGCGRFVFVKGWSSSMRHFEGVGAATRGGGRAPRRHRGQVHRGRCHAGPSDTDTTGTGVRMRESGPLAAAERAVLLPDESRVARCSGSSSRGCTLCARNGAKVGGRGCDTAAWRHRQASGQAGGPRGEEKCRCCRERTVRAGEQQKRRRG